MRMTKRRTFRSSATCLILIALAIVFPRAVAAQTFARPVLQVDVANPTKDKPQSKLWFAHGSWWAWLPVKGGSSVWKRSSDGWRRQSHLDAALKGHPGQADVWAEEDTATAVLVQPDRLAVIQLRWVNAAQRYELAVAPATLQMPPRRGAGDVIETATIARDTNGRWWIAYAWQREVVVRYSTGNIVSEWSPPVTVSTVQTADDDICTIIALRGSVAVVWSDQDHDAVYFRRHDDGDSPEEWKPAEIVASGGNTADDHLNSTVADDGTLYVVTKNSVDELDQPQLVLRVRETTGTWTNIPYAPRTKLGEPSRPIVLLDSGSSRLFLLHTIYRKDGTDPRRDVIVVQSSGRQRIDLSSTATVLLDSGTRLNDVTGAKAALPTDQPWIVLASDQEGRVFEAQLN